MSGSSESSKLINNMLLFSSIFSKWRTDSHDAFFNLKSNALYESLLAGTLIKHKGLFISVLNKVMSLILPELRKLKGYAQDEPYSGTSYILCLKKGMLTFFMNKTDII